MFETTLDRLKTLLEPILETIRNTSPNAVIALDRDMETVHFYRTENPRGSATGAEGSAIVHETGICTNNGFDEEFFEHLKNVLKIYGEKIEKANKVTLVLPDTLFFTDTVKIPTIQKKTMATSLELLLGTFYKNSKDLRYRTRLLTQNKRNATYGVLGIRRELLRKFVTAVEEAGFSVTSTTYASAAEASAALTLNGKLKTAAYLLADVRENASYFAYVYAGRAVGYYTLPFGYSSFREDALLSEAGLFDHRIAELLVLNAKEKAKRKRLTGMDAASAPEEQAAAEPTNSRQARRMLRGGEQTPEQTRYANFRIFLKWTLELIRNNPDLTAIEMPKTVYFNAPADCAPLFEKAAQETEGTAFLPLFAADVPGEIAKYPELWGGFFPKFEKFTHI